MRHFTEAVFHGEDDCVTVRKRQCSDKIHGNVRPRMVRLAGAWCEVLCRLQTLAALYEIPVVFFQRWPPETLLEEITSSPGWHATREKCPHFSTSGHRLSGT